MTTFTDDDGFAPEDGMQLHKVLLQLGVPSAQLLLAQNLERFLAQSPMARNPAGRNR